MSLKDVEPPYRVWEKVRFNGRSERMLINAISILAEYQEQQIELTARSVHYQFVARGIIVEGVQFDTKGSKVAGGAYINSFKNYKMLCDVLNRGKLGGWIPWDLIVDTTREMSDAPHWDDGPSEFMTDYARHIFKVDMWGNQDYRPIVGVEKDALVGVIQNVCRELRVPFISLRGYASGTALYNVGRKCAEWWDRGQQPIFFHIGDHDPSGIDMTRDNRERIFLFSDDGVEVQRIALNRDQVDRYKPPPNFAKETDGRYDAYAAEHGTVSWEVDALEPRVLVQTIRNAVEPLIDDERWGTAKHREEKLQEEIAVVGKHWDHALSAARKAPKRKK